MLKFYSNFDPIFHFLKDKYQDKPFTIWHEAFPSDPKQLEDNPFNFLIVLEPNELFGLHNTAIANYNLFTAILTWSDLIHQNCPNGVRFTFNGRVLDDEFLKELETQPKQFEVSFLSGATNWIEGHHLRQRIYALGNKVHIPKQWYHTLEDFDAGAGVRPGYGQYTRDLSHIPKGVDPVGFGKRKLYRSMFNVITENVKHLNWYNKIGDTFLAKCVPIYWGCPNIEEFGYDERGIIRFDNENELIDILNTLTPQTYQQMKPYIDYNYEVAKLDMVEDRATQFFDSFIQANNL
jgi:hypothetical protein